MNVDELLREHAPSESATRRETRRLRATVLENAGSGAGEPHGMPAVQFPRRRRRTLVRVVVAAAILGIVASGLTITLDGGSPASAAQERFTHASATPAYSTYGAFSAGNTVYIGNHHVTFDQKIKAMYYTSAGVLVRMGKVAYTDTDGPSHYTLIRPDGTHTAIDLTMSDRVPATDPDSPDVAYAEPTGDHWSYVVIDLRTGREVARAEVRGAFTWGGWEAPPVTMSGHRMWGLFDDGWIEYDWQTGKTRLVPGTKGAPLAAAHGRYAQFDGRKHTEWVVRDFVTGDVVRKIPAADGDFGELSPDGRFARFVTMFAPAEKALKIPLKTRGTGKHPAHQHATLVRLATSGDPSPDPVRFVTIDSGSTIKLPRGAEYGWTPGGNAFAVDAKRDRLTVCDPGTGKCDLIDLAIGSGAIKLGGLSYES